MSRNQKFATTLTKSLVFAIATVLATLALAGTIRNSSSGPSDEYVALFTDATSLNKGDDVRMAGVKVGTVTDIEIANGRTARVTFTVSESAPLSEGSTAQLRFRNLVGQRYVAVQPAEVPGKRLAAGHVFDLDDTEPALDLTVLFNGFQPLFRLLDPEDVNELSGQIIAVFQGEGPTVEGLLSSTASLTSTLADRDQVIGDLITNLSSVLGVVEERSGQLDTTLVTLQQLVSGLAEDRETIGSTIDGMSDLSDSVAGLLQEGRAPLKGSIKALGDLSAVLADNEDVIAKFLRTLPTKLDRVGRLTSYGSWVNFYVCSIEGRIPLPEGYYGDLGVQPVAGRCK
ncbi:MCE family protein [Nocardioides sp. CPCC 206347]|uniref:MCE family protein n=1 Tax=unclassified Nocardioides TaxID=2615069 RepID=UPI00360693F9